MEFSFYTANKIVFKKNAIDELAEHIRPLNGTQYLLVIDPAFYQTDVMDRILGQIKKLGAGCTVFHETSGEPTVDLVDSVHTMAKEDGCDAVISVGGGTCIDIGKAVSATLTNGIPSVDYLEYVGNGKKVVNHPVPFVTCPTTAGTGSEVTKNAVLGSTTQNFKRSMRSDMMVADISIIDPTLTINCPPKVTAYSGIDAMTHLIEAYTTFRATPISDGLSRKGIGLAGKYLKRAVKNGKNDYEAREGMSAAALLGGMAFANSGLGAAHGIGMAIGIRYHVAHGRACGILLPHVVKLNSDVAMERLDIVGEELTGKHFDKKGEGTEAAINFLFDLNKEIGVEYDYKFLNIPESELMDIAQQSIGTSMKSNPKPMDQQSIYNFLKTIC
ncbi:MAG: iron-containing alcohol dehydrogenase [Bilifractor sp.]|jgi:alcohol dehydrogenase class IV